MDRSLYTPSKQELVKYPPSCMQYGYSDILTLTQQACSCTGHCCRLTHKTQPYVHTFAYHFLRRNVTQHTHTVHNTTPTWRISASEQQYFQVSEDLPARLTCTLSNGKVNMSPIETLKPPPSPNRISAAPSRVRNPKGAWRPKPRDDLSRT